MSIQSFFTDKEKLQITNAIKAAELETSGEVRVHIEGHCSGKQVLDCAAFWFKKLKMHKTALRNGVLFYLAVNDHQFAVLGDIGINAKVPDDFWDEIKERMLAHFKKDEFALGLDEGIRMAGEQLQTHFPYQDDDINELPDDISFGKN